MCQCWQVALPNKVILRVVCLLVSTNPQWLIRVVKWNNMSCGLIPILDHIRSLFTTEMPWADAPLFRRSLGVQISIHSCHQSMVSTQTWLHAPAILAHHAHPLIQFNAQSYFHGLSHVCQPKQRTTKKAKRKEGNNPREMWSERKIGDVSIEKGSVRI